MSSFNNCIEEQGPIISTIIFSILFVISEALPYINSLEGNGIVDEIIKLVQCAVKKKEQHLAGNVEQMV